MELNAFGTEEIHLARAQHAVAPLRDVGADVIRQGEQKVGDSGGHGGGDGIGGREQDVGATIGGTPDEGGGAVAGEETGAC